MAFDRRNFMLGSAVLAGAGMLSSLITPSSARAAAPKPSNQNPGYYKTKVGGMTVTTIVDGSMQMPNEIFTDVSQERIKASRDKYFISQEGPYPAYINAFLIQSGGKNILIDTGAKSYLPTTGLTEGTLASLGITSDHIDEIILTHAHPDHANGLLNSAGGIAYKKAVVKVCEDEVNFWFDDAKMASMPGNKGAFETARKDLGPYKESGQLQTYKFDADLGNGLSSVALPGHTPGHSGVMVSDGNEQLLIWGDIVHNAFLQFDHPDQTLAFDIDEAKARETRRKLFDRVATDRLRIGGMHLPMNALGHLAKRGEGYEFVPQRWEVTI